MHKYIFIAGFFILFVSCNKNNVTDPNTLSDIPVVTGIKVTTFSQPEGTGLVYGTPSYPMANAIDSEISAYPNPYIISNWVGPNIYADHFITFFNLTGKLKILIYKAISLQENEVINSQKLDNSNYSPIVTLNKNDDNKFFIYDLKDKNKNYLSTGLYRAYFYSEDDKLQNFIDLYIVLPYDCDTFTDYTGWLDSLDATCERYKNFDPGHF